MATSRQVEPHRTPAFEKSGSFFKVDEAQGIAYGWAIVCEENGQPYFDLHGDHIPEAAMTAALADFAKFSRVGLDQHAGAPTGEHVFLYPLTKSTCAGLGITSGKYGAIVGYQPDNPADLAMIASGARTGFSIGGVLIESDETELGKALLAKNAGGKNGKRKGRVFRTFKIHEISIVDRPAQEGATVGYVKRFTVTNPTIEKAVKLTSVEDGHQHMIWLDDVTLDGYCSTSYDVSGGMSDPDSHNHRVLWQDGKLVVSTNFGHTHTIELPEGWVPRVPETPDPANNPTATGVEVIAASAPESQPIEKSTPPRADLTPQPNAASVSTAPKENTMSAEMIADLNRKLAKAMAEADLNDAQRAYYKRLSPTAQDAFLAKSVADRDAEVKAAIVHKSGSQVFYTFDDQRLVEVVKQNDALQAQLASQIDVTKAAQHLDFAKSIVGNFAGDEPTRVLLAKAVSSIADDAQRGAVIEMLKGADSAIEMMTKAQGHANPGPVVTDAEQAFYAKRDEWAKANSVDMTTDVARAVATRKFAQTPEGSPLYKAFTQARPAVAVS